MPRLGGTVSSPWAISALENQLNQLAEPAMALVSSDGLALDSGSAPSSAFGLSGGVEISAFSSRITSFPPVSRFSSDCSSSSVVGPCPSFAAPFAGLGAFDVMLSFVVVAAKGRDLEELPILRDK